jgi:biotin-dependent carboxylase-like uncharacterized protein
VSLTVLAPGLQTTVQDLGRVGHRAAGVGVGGAADAFSHRAANLLVGNDDHAATLEICLSGPTLRAEAAVRIALTGADCDAWVDGQAIPGWRGIDLPRGATLRIGACRRGARAYLACGGGLDLVPVLGSVGTDLRAGFGGVDGRALRAGDVLALRAPTRSIAALRIDSRWIDPCPTLDLGRDAVAQVLPGRDRLADPDALFDATWRIDAASDRQGLRLAGPHLRLAAPREMVSEPLVPGTIQLPPDGRPILLLADAQTIGGYPVLGHVARADLPRLAQCRPGDALWLQRGNLAQALQRAAAQARHLARIAIALGARQPRRG